MEITEELKLNKENKEKENNITDTENKNLKSMYSWKYNEKIPVILNSTHIRDVIDIDIKYLLSKQEKICKEIDKIINKFSSLED